jgi:hypothetical protein
MNGLMVNLYSPERVPGLYALVNPSWHLTPVGHLSSAFAVDIFHPAWLSSGRWPLTILYENHKKTLLILAVAIVILCSAALLFHAL